jgi:hypothetical protein
MKKVSKLSLLMFFTLYLQYSYGQRVAYFKDFDYFKMIGIDTIRSSGKLSGFYVTCVYDSNNKVIEICSTSKRSWEHAQTSYCVPVVYWPDKNILVFGSGKTRQGYTRALFQKKITESDSAMIVQDTLILKRTSPKYYRIQLFTKLAGDSIHLRELVYPINKLTSSKLASLKSFKFYNDWFMLDHVAAKIVEGVIRPDNNPVLTYKVLKSESYVNKIDITKERLKDLPGMPISLFWLINTGWMN